MQVCRICLCMNRKLYKMQEKNLQTLYEELTGLNTSDDCKLPNHLCWECAHRLTRCHQFRKMAMRSHGLMMDILKTARCLTLKSIQSIDGYSFFLTSNLAQKTYDANHSDLHIYDTAPLNIINDNFNSTEEENTQDAHENIQEVNFQLKEETDTLNDFENNLNLEDNSTSSSDIVLARRIKKFKERKNKKKRSKKETITPKIDRRRKPAAEVLNTDIFSISHLTVDEQIQEVQLRKESSNYKGSEFRCTECFKGFIDEEVYRCHMIRHTNQSGAYECEICKIRFKKQHALRNHAASHVQKFACKRCPYVTTRRHAAKLHEDFHNGARYQCPHCQEDFSKFSTYMSHVRIKHPSDHLCALCGHSFVSEKGLALHKKLKHRFDDQPVPEDGPFCEQCEVRFVSEEALDRHLKLSARHSGDFARKRARGEVTEESTRRKKKDSPTKKKDVSLGETKDLMKKSKLDDKPEGPIPCEQCDMQLPDCITYYRHFRRSHPDKNRTNYPSVKSRCMCEVCGKMFQSLALLHDHSFTHTDSKQFKCATCGKTFQRKYRLIAHRRLHDGRRAAHACGVCGKLFSTTSNMQRHMVSHTGLKPFKCEMCGKCFKHASEKRVHITYVHLKKPWPKRSRGKRWADGQKIQLQPHPANSTEADIVQPLWPACNDPKVIDIVHDRPAYYNVKI